MKTWAAAGIPSCLRCDGDGWVRRTFAFDVRGLPELRNLCVDHPCRCRPRNVQHAELLPVRLLRFPGWV